MEIDLIKQLTLYRMTIGYLGDRDQFGLWQSAFFTQGSRAFLDPLFPRTRLLAQCNGVTRAAILVHDERIGVGQTYHLFRLPEELEQGIHQALHDPAFQRVIPERANSSDVLSKLREFGAKVETTGVGPVRVGGREDLYNPKIWRQVAGLYLQAFQLGKEIYPYFTDRS
jgi:hypothetical protein